MLDVHEFLAERGLSEPFRATLQPADHRRLPRRLPHDSWAGHQQRAASVAAHDHELQLREATDAGVCCGSAGIYNLVQPQEAAELGQLKVEDLSRTGASVIASANIGCTLQLRRHLQQDGPKVLHPMELLARAADLTIA